MSSEPTKTVDQPETDAQLAARMQQQEYTQVQYAGAPTYPTHQAGYAGYPPPAGGGQPGQGDVYVAQPIYTQQYPGTQAQVAMPAAAHGHGYPHGHPQGGMYGAGGQAVIIVPNEMQMTEGEMQYLILLQHAKATKLFSLVDTFLVFINIFVWGFFALLVLPGPICGYMGARDYKKELLVVYSAFCILSVIGSFITLGFNQSGVGIFLNIIMIICKIYIARIVIRFYGLVKGIQPDQLNQIRQMESTMHVPMRYY
eukprot:GFYU01001063.1.p1 GENE.GFYU01001063.1~~GFYU01001063.1.p1  ORF type:complete len:255 (+),score=54.57 GFYU01001063.1:95-859(+)